MTYEQFPATPLVYSILHERTRKPIRLIIMFLLVFITSTAHSGKRIHVAQGDILQIKAIPFYPERTRGDRRYWNIVRMGKDTFDDLLLLIDDPSDTSISVPLTGGTYAVGDIAVIALMDIVHGLPVLSMIQVIQADKGTVSEMDVGFNLYWNFVRESGTNRSRLRISIKKWLEKNKNNLIWIEKKGHPAGGWWTIQKRDEYFGGHNTK